jgi:hypothetical protein
MMDKPKIPKFSNEADEAQWWYENREWLSEQFQEAAREGRLKRGSTVLERIRAAHGTQLLTVTLSPEDLAKIHRLAEMRKVDDAAVASELLSEALKGA